MLGLVPAPPDVHAPGGGIPVLVAMGGLGVAAVAIAVTFAVRRRDPLPAIACAGAVIAVLNEPIYDLLGQIVYASNHPRAFTAFDREIPLFLVGGYIPWVGLLPWVLADRMRVGIRRQTLVAIAGASFVSVVLVEVVGTTSDNWAYYGEAPLRYLGVAPQMAPMPLVCAWMLATLAPRLHGLGRGLVVLVPPVALASVYAAAGWPMYFALNSDVPAPLDVLAGLTTLAICVGIVWTVAIAAEPVHERIGGA